MDYPTVEKMREEITELKVRDTEQKIQIVNLREDITEIKESVKVINSNLEAFTKEMKNGYITKRAAEWFYSSIGKWVIGLLVTNAASIVGLILTLLKGGK